MIKDIELQADIQNEYNMIMWISKKRDITIEEYNKLKAYDESLCEDFQPTYRIVATTATPISSGGDFESVINGYFSMENEALGQAKHDARIQALEAGLVDWHDKY
jgi:hypothetical protein